MLKRGGWREEGERFFCPLSLYTTPHYLLLLVLPPLSEYTYPTPLYPHPLTHTQKQQQKEQQIDQTTTSKARLNVPIYRGLFLTTVWHEIFGVLIFAIFFPQINITGNIFPAGIYSRVNNSLI